MSSERSSARPEPTTEIGPQCGTPFQCPFLDYCSLGVPCTDYPVTCLPKHGKIVSRLAEEGFKDIRDIPEDRLENATLERVYSIIADWTPCR
ncbi:MAG: hypothetical protein ACLQO6_14575 [Desulfomonilaceae bacterium]